MARDYRDMIGRTIAPLLGLDWQQMADMEARGINLGMVVPFAPRAGLGQIGTPAKPLNEAIAGLNAELEKAGRLGFDTLQQARNAIRSNPDWATRWDVSGHPELVDAANHYVRAVGNQSNLERLGLAPENYTAPSTSDIIRQYMQQNVVPQPQAPQPPTPSNILQFRPRQ